MTCRELIEFLDDYFAGDLTAEVRAEFDRHLGLCRDCRQYLTSYRRTVELVRSAAADDPAAPAEAPQGVINAIRAAQRHMN